MTNHELHMMLWGELAITGWVSKSTSIILKRTPVPNGCYACVEAGYVEEDDESCMNITEDCCPVCPIDWGVEPVKNRCTCELTGSPYKYWQSENNVFMRKKFAAIIRDLEWRKK